VSARKLSVSDQKRKKCITGPASTTRGRKHEGKTAVTLGLSEGKKKEKKGQSAKMPCLKTLKATKKRGEKGKLLGQKKLLSGGGQGCWGKSPHV